MLRTGIPCYACTKKIKKAEISPARISGLLPRIFLPVSYRCVENVVNNALKDFLDEAFFNIAYIQFVVKIFIEGEALVFKTHFLIQRVDISGLDSNGEPRGGSAVDLCRIVCSSGGDRRKPQVRNLALELELPFLGYHRKIGVLHKVILQVVGKDLRHVCRAKIGIVVKFGNADGFRIRRSAGHRVAGGHAAGNE